MTTNCDVCTVQNYVDEREAFWTVLEIPAHSETGEPIADVVVGAGQTEDAAIADFRIRKGLADDVVVRITHRDNVNIEIHVGGSPA